MDEQQFAHPTERMVWEHLTAQRPHDWIVLPNLRLTEEAKDHEIDLLVLAPGIGVLALEVEGGQVWVQDGQWRQGRAARRIHPISTTRSSLYALREYVETDPRWGGRRRVLFSHALVLPNTAVDDDFAHPECPRWQVHGRGDLPHLVERLEAALLRQADARDGRQQPPTADDCRLIVEILRGRNLPVRDVLAQADANEQRAQRLTAEQASLLKVTRLLNRVEVRGGAGSGKTLLAQAQAQELSAGGGGRPAQRVALLCYSLGLATGLERVALTWPRRRQPAFVGSFEQLSKYLGVTDFADRDDSDFWEVRLPALMSELAADLPPERRFDAVVVDEAQDFANDWWTPLVGILRDPEEGGLFAYSDEHQRVFARFGRPPVALVPLVLDKNLRNTRQISSTFRTLAPSGMTVSDYEGPEATPVACSVDEAVDVADDQVDLLIDEGWRLEDIALLTTGRRHPEQVQAQARGQQAYWATFWEDDTVFYGHVLGCKGLERRCVVLALNDDPDSDRARERLYVGLSRATERLVVVGDPESIRMVGGESVLGRLTESPASTG